MKRIFPENTTPFYRTLRSPVALAVTFLIITLSVFFVLRAKQSQGPYWLGHNSDPDYCYLLNACSIAQLHSPGLFGHPGTPLQVLGAIVISVGHVFANTGIPLDQDIIERPEHYLNSISFVLIVGLFIGILWLGISSYLSTGSPALALFSMTIILTSSAVLVSTVRVNPEPMLLLVALMLQISLVSTFKKDRNKDLPFIVFSFMVGLGIATKVTFAPFAVIPLVVLKGLKQKLLYCAGTIGFFILFTLPAAVHYRAMGRWFLNIAFHTGIYGYGTPGIINPGNYVTTLKSLFSAEPLLFYSLALGVAYLVVILLFNDRNSGMGTLSKTLAACLISQLLSILMVAKHPDQRYLVPALAFIGFNAGMMVLHASISFKTHKNAIALISIGYLFLLVSPAFSYPVTLKNMKARQVDALHIASIVQNNRSAIKVFYYGASAVPFALYFGNDYTGKRFSTKLQALYPGILFYEPWGPSLHDYMHSLPADSLAVLTQQNLLFQGRSFETRGAGLNLQKPGFPLKKIVEQSNEALYQTVAGN